MTEECVSEGAIRRNTILINDRSHLPEDFSTPEQKVTPPVTGRRWESGMPMNQNWGYTELDHHFKEVASIAKGQVRCARFGGNLVGNIGPHAAGSVPNQSSEILNSAGEWLSQAGQSIYDSRRAAFTECDPASGSLLPGIYCLNPPRSCRHWAEVGGGSKVRRMGAFACPFCYSSKAWWAFSLLMNSEVKVILVWRKWFRRSFPRAVFRW